MTPTVDKATVKKALGMTGSAATTLAKGPAATGFFVARRGVKELRSRRAARRVDAPLPVRGRSRGTSTPVVVVAVLVAVAAAVAFARTRRREVPPITDAPPSLNAPQAPASTNGAGAH